MTIRWTKFLRDDSARKVVRDFAAREISAKEMQSRLKGYASSSDLDLMDSIEYVVLLRRAQNALSKFGSPITGKTNLFLPWGE